MGQSILLYLVGSFVVYTGRGTVTPDLDLILYGATGCVGGFAAGHLANQPGLKWAIAGRDEKKLQELMAKLGSEGGMLSKPEIIVSSLNAKANMSWVKRAKAVATAAGPFSVHGGEFLVKACAENGVHYTDTSDEFYWQRWMVDRHHAAAKASGARITLSSGFCFTVADIGAQLAMEGLGKADGSTVNLDAWLEGYSGGISAGVINTGKAIANATFPKEWNTDPYVLVPDVQKDARIDTINQGMTFPSWVAGEGPLVSNIFGPYDARLLRRSFASLNQRVKLRVAATTGMYTKWTAFLASHPGSWTSLTKCPSKPIYDGGSWSYRFNAHDGKSSKSVLLSGDKDPGYHFTAFGLAEAGLCLAGKTPNCLRKGVYGVVTSMSTMDPDVMQQRLASVGLLKVEVTTDFVPESSNVVVI